MRIGLVSTVSAPVRQDSTGSIESWTWLLTRELARLGHQVTVFGCAGSEVDGNVVATLPGRYGVNGAYDDWQLCEWTNLCRAVEQSSRFDVVHAQAYLWGIPLEPLARAPMVHTLHIVPDENSARLRQSSPASCVTALSKHQWSAYPQAMPAAVIPHGVDISQFHFRSAPEDYVLYLGRFTSGKGPLNAIRAARALGLRLVMAGPDSPYYREKIKQMVDGKTVEYVGFVQGAQRARLLAGARVLLCPLQYPEAFGLVMVEAMLCGTPVAAMRLGAAPEIIEEGIGGFTACNLEEFTIAIQKCFALDRQAIRLRAERLYSADRMALDYVNVYSMVCDRESADKQRRLMR